MSDMIEETPVDTYKPVVDKQDFYSCIEDMAKHPHKAQQRLKNIEDLVEDVIIHERFGQLIKEADDKRKGETILHAAIKHFQFKSNEEKSVVEIMLSNFPKLILQDRGNTEYAGQTPLHMAVCKGNIWLVGTLLKRLSRKETKHWKVTLLKRKANGVIFRNTVMMGELPLTIAALTFNKGMFDLLLNEGAELDSTNKSGDNLCHSLIRYGYLYPDKMDEVIEMCRKINEDPAPYETGPRAERNRKLRKKIWLMDNKDGLNPLQLAAFFGLHRVFCFIMDQEAYCFDNSKDGLFDIKIYDVTEIDAISSMKSSDIKGINDTIQSGLTPENLPRRKITDEYEPYRRSILMMLLDLEPAVAFQFTQFPPIQRIVNRKWVAYRKYFFPWWIFHSVYMFFLTWYCIERSKHVPNSATGFDLNGAPKFEKKIPSDPFITTYGIISVVVAVVYILQDIIRFVIGRMPWTFYSFWNPYSSGWFRVMFILFGFCLIVDFFVTIWSTYYENYLLIIAMIIGWFLTVFFLRALRPFSFCTVLIQKVLIGDVFRFFVILGIEVLAFATAMQMALQGSDAADDADFLNFWRVLFSMFTLMIGVGDLAPIYETRQPWLCILIFIGFVIMTTLLMLNALIAMMGRTCMELVENVGNVKSHDRHWKLQKLSVILFLESIMPKALIFKVGIPQNVKRYNNSIHRRKTMQRYMLEIRSIQNEEDSDDREGTMPSAWGFKTAVFNALQNQYSPKRERPLSAISDKIRDFFQKKRSSKKMKEKKVAEQVDEYDHTEPVDHRPAQIQPPVSHVFGLNPMAADNGFPNGGFVRMDSRPAEIDIYQISQCRNCSIHDITSLGRHVYSSSNDGSRDGIL